MLTRQASCAIRQAGGDADAMQLCELIDMRYREQKPTIVISNFGLKELGLYLTERGVDRLREAGGKVVIFDWESHRGKSCD